MSEIRVNPETGQVEMYRPVTREELVAAVTEAQASHDANVSAHEAADSQRAEIEAQYDQVMAHFNQTEENVERSAVSLRHHEQILDLFDQASDTPAGEAPVADEESIDEETTEEPVEDVAEETESLINSSDEELVIPVRRRAKATAERAAF